MEVGPVPHRGDGYTEELWNKLAPKLGRRRWWSPWLSPAKMGSCAGCGGAGHRRVLCRPLLAGRAEQVATNSREGQVRERVLVVAVGDHLERSKMLLVEIANADPDQKIDLFDQREVAEDLVYTNRLYRQTAMTAGEGRMAGLLEELERVLIEIAHSPGRAAWRSPAEPARAHPERRLDFQDSSGRHRSWPKGKRYEVGLYSFLRNVRAAFGQSMFAPAPPDHLILSAPAPRRSFDMLRPAPAPVPPDHWQFAIAPARPVSRAGPGVVREMR